MKVALHGSISDCKSLAYLLYAMWENSEKNIVVVIQLLSHVWLFATPWTTTH